MVYITDDNLSMGHSPVYSLCDVSTNISANYTVYTCQGFCQTIINSGDKFQTTHTTTADTAEVLAKDTRSVQVTKLSTLE